MCLSLHLRLRLLQQPAQHSPGDVDCPDTDQSTVNHWAETHVTAARKAAPQAQHRHSDRAGGSTGAPHAREHKIFVSKYYALGNCSAGSLFLLGVLTIYLGPGYQVLYYSILVFIL